MGKPAILSCITAVMLALAVGFLLRTGKIDEWRTPGLAQCERYAKSGLSSPSSYRRVSFVAVDTPVTKKMLAESAYGPGFEAMASIAKKPGIRGIALDYDADNAYGTSIRGGTACYFPMSDIKVGVAFGDLDSLESMAETSATLGRLGIGKGADALCCLRSTFDHRQIPTNPMSAEAAAAASDAAGIGDKK